MIPGKTVWMATGADADPATVVPLVVEALSNNLEICPLSKTTKPQSRAVTSPCRPLQKSDLRVLTLSTMPSTSPTTISADSIYRVQ